MFLQLKPFLIQFIEIYRHLLMEDPAANLSDHFGTGAKYSEKVITVNSTKKIIELVETDEEFIRDLQAIKEHTKSINKHFFAKRADLTEQEYRFVEQTGEVHYEANLFNVRSFTDHDKVPKEDRCKCGCGRVRGDPLPYCIDEEKNAYFGQGIILFFYYTKKLMWLVLTAILIYGIYSFVSNFVSDETDQNCKKPGALDFLCYIKVKGEIANKKDSRQLIVIQLWLGFAFCLIWSIGIRLIKALGRVKSQQIDDLLDSSSDETVFLEKLPVKGYHQRDILIFMKKLWDQIKEVEGRPLKIKSVQIIYDMEEVRKRISEIQNIAEELLNYLEKQKVEGTQKKVRKAPFRIKKQQMKSYEEKKQELQDKYQQLIDLREKFLVDENFRKQYASECALVHFAESDDQTIFINNYGLQKSTIVQKYLAKLKNYFFENTESLLFKEKYIQIYRAPEPSDIFWQHCEKKVQIRNTVFVWFLNIVLNLISFGFLYLFVKIREWNPDVRGLSIVAIVLVNLFNRLIWNILLKIVFIEENYTKTINIMSVMNKSYVSQLINIIIIPIILNTVEKDTISGPTGLSGQVHDFQLTSFIFMTLFNIVNVPHRITLFLKCFPCTRRAIIRYFCRVSGDFDTYEEMKEALMFLYEPPLVPVAGFYVYITSIIGQAFFFCHLEPILIFYLLGNIILFHLMNRFIVFKMSKMTDLLDISVFDTVVGFALNVPLLYGIASILFLKLLGHAANFAYYVPSILCLVIWLLSAQSPFGLYEKLTNCFIKLVKKEQKQNQQGRLETSKDIQLAPESRQHFDFLGEIMMGSIKKIQQQGESNVDNGGKQANTSQTIKAILDFASKRKENYFGAIGVNELFNLESKIQEVKGKYHGKNKQFCERFSLGMKQEKFKNQYYHLHQLNMEINLS